MAGSMRAQIVNELVTLFKTIDGTGSFKSNLYGNVTNRMLYLDEVNDWPYVAVNSDTESREYQPGNFAWGFLRVVIRIYANEDEPEQALENVMFDIETLLDANNDLTVGTNNLVQISLDRLDWDGGALAPLAFGEITCTLRYEIK